MRELHQALESQEFASEDDLHAFMAGGGEGCAVRVFALRPASD